MKTLHFIRHAKSEWDKEDQRDIDRTLNSRGIEACKVMARRIVSAGCHFENVFCSPAVRAQQTIELLAMELMPKEIKWDVDYQLYTFESSELLDWLAKLEDKYDDVVVVGHNPAITELVNVLGEQHLSNVPTCGYVQMKLDITTWNEIAANCGQLKEYLTPKG